MVSHRQQLPLNSFWERQYDIHITGCNSLGPQFPDLLEHCIGQFEIGYTVQMLDRRLLDSHPPHSPFATISFCL